jgi:phosphoribosylformylglycinamidine cyclo-ligase
VDTPITYADSGVDYDPLDAFKRACQQAAATTSGPLTEVPGSRGDSAYLVDCGDGTLLAHVEEGLGTKNLVADAVGDPSLYHAIGIDTVATIVNDLITVGCLPAVVAMHAAVGDAAWFENRERAEALAAGFAEGCRRSGATWGGGETPALSGLVNPDTIVLAGSAIGRMQKTDQIDGDVRVGDQMIFLASTGVQTNGLTLCRRIGERVGFDQPCGDTTFGRSLLEPSSIYADFVKELSKTKTRPHYLVHLTGHGFRKLMRLQKPLTYTVSKPGTPQPVFDFINQHGPVERREMFATFNMGVGFVAYVRPDAVDATLAAAEATGHRAWIGGEVMGDDRRAVEVPSEGIVFEDQDLAVR